MTERARDPQRGFSLLELLVVVAIIGILANAALFATRRATTKARAAALMQDLATIESAAIQYVRDNGTNPRSRRKGKEPKELAPYLSGAVRWDRSDWGYKLKWDNWEGRRISTRRGIELGVSIYTTNKDLIAALSQFAGDALVVTAKHRYTYQVTAPN